MKIVLNPYMGYEADGQYVYAVDHFEEEIKSYFNYDPSDDTVRVVIPEFIDDPDLQLIKTEDAGFTDNNWGLRFFFADRYENGESTGTVRIGVRNNDEMVVEAIDDFVEESVETRFEYYYPFHSTIERHEGFPTTLYEGSPVYLNYEFFDENGQNVEENWPSSHIVSESGTLNLSYNERTLYAEKAGTGTVYFLANHVKTASRDTLTGEILEFEVTVLPRTMKADADALYLFKGQAHSLKITGLEQADDSLTDHSFFSRSYYNDEQGEFISIIDQTGTVTGYEPHYTSVPVYIVSRKGQYLEIPVYFFDISLSDEETVYNGKPFTPTIASFCGACRSLSSIGTENYEQDAYSVTYENNTNAGTGKMIIALDDFRDRGTIILEKEFTIQKASLSKASVTVADQVYTGSAIKPSVKVKVGDRTLKAGTDYTVTYKNNTEVGKATVTIKGKGNYKGSCSADFTIQPKSITPTVVLSKKTYTYDGSAKKPKVTVKDGSKILTTSEYSVSYASGRTNAGTYKVKVTLKGNYKGTKTVSFTIEKAKQPMTVTAKTPSVKASDLKKKAQTIKISQAVTIKNAKGTKSYEITDKGKLTKIKINAETGSITVPKGTGKGTYTIKIKITAAGTKNYKPGSKNVSVKIKIQ